MNIPWVELNWWTSPNEAFGEKVVQGLREWQLKGTRLAIVSSQVGQADTVYGNLMDRVPNKLSIIGGIKTLGLEEDFTDLDAWNDIVDTAREIRRFTGVPVIVMENEKALEDFHYQGADIDLEALRPNLQQLAQTGLMFWWWMPRLWPSTSALPNRFEKTRDLVMQIARYVPRSYFITNYTSWPDWHLNANKEMDMRREMKELLPKHNLMLELGYVTDTGFMTVGNDLRECYTSDIFDPTFDIYGLNRWRVAYPGYRSFADTAWRQD